MGKIIAKVTASLFQVLDLYGFFPEAQKSFESYKIWYEGKCKQGSGGFVSQSNQITQENSDLADNSGSIRTLVAAVLTGLIFWSLLFALMFICLTS